MIRIRPNIARTLRNATLQRNMKRTLETSLRSRESAQAEVKNWEELRVYARAVKMHALNRLYDHLTLLEEKVQANGGTVHWAGTDADAVRIVLELAREHGARSVVKSKTMLGEEIRLNENLEAAGIRVVETDLGEYIVQLAGEPPFHIVTPAFHKSRGEVAALFAEKLGIEPVEDPAQLTLAARRTLRKEFLEARVGVSGVNFAVAETGTIVVVENEGNARLSTSLPRVHIALMGIEKVIPRTRDLSVLLKLLVRSGTGQKITSYVNLISGPRKSGEVDGPEEFHLVLVDNGRSRILQDPLLRETLCCIRCGACLNACPVYQKIGGHAYGSVYQGPIGAILTPQLLSIRQAPEHPFASSLCGACEEVCPVKIEIPRILLHLRRETQRRSIHLVERLAMTTWAWLNSSPKRFVWAGHKLRQIYALAVRNDRLRLPLPPLYYWQKSRNLPGLPEKSFRELAEEKEPN